MTSRVVEPEDGTADPRRWKTLGALGIAQLMLILDVSVVTVALPDIGTDLGIGRGALTWVMSAYTLTFGGLLLLGGRLADRFSSRRMVLIGLTVFTLASLASGLAGNSTMLLAGRVAQGVGAALLSPAALSAVVSLFAGEERNKALGVWSALSGGGAAIGVLLGGLLTGGPGWPWIFYVNVPIGIILVFVLGRLVPTRSRAPERRPLDLLGAVLVTAATGSVIVSMIDAGDRGWSSAATIIGLLVGLVLYGLFVWRQRVTPAPLMDLHLLARRPVAAGTVLIVLATAVMIMTFFLGTFLFQRVFGFGPILTGLLFLPVAIGTIAGAQLAGTIIGRVGARPLVAVGAVVTAGGLFVPAYSGNQALAVTGMTIGAAGIGALFVVASATALGQVSPQESGIASGIVSTFHEFGSAAGAAAASSIAAASISGQSHTALGNGFWFAAVTALVAGAAGLLIVPRKRDDSASHQSAHLAH